MSAQQIKMAALTTLVAQLQLSTTANTENHPTGCSN
jgi:hypothetical protein